MGISVNTVGVAEEFPSIPNVTVEFDIDESVLPVRHAYVSIPAHFREPAIMRLREMERTGIIEKVIESPRWLSGLSAVPKGKGDFRLVVNMRGPNKAIRRQYHCMPRVEEIRTKLAGARWFTKLDLSSAFHHMRLSPKSSELTTFMAPDGMYRFKRLVYGVNCAPEIFQRQMESILEGMTSVIVYIDDVLIFESELEKLRDRTAEVLRRLKEKNLSLNEEKCEYEKESLAFLGHQVSAAGLNIEDQKVKDVRQFRSPRNTTELKSFLGLVNYVRDYIPHFADLMRPLRQAESSGRFLWTMKEEESFKKLKLAIVNCTMTQGFFSLDDATELYTDASPYAVGAVLVQVNTVGENRIISFASKSLTVTEQRYAQTQREALAIVWAVEHYYYYLLGAKFTVKTDAEGIKFIFDRNSDKPKRLLRRAEGWAMRLDMFDYEIEAVSGIKNIADPSSRLYHSEEPPQPYREEETPCEIARVEINEITDVYFNEDHLPILEVREATKNSREMTSLMEAIISGVWDESSLQYKPMAAELDVIDGVVTRGGLVVVPPELRAKALKIAHKGHLGMTKTKSVLKERVWWPKMNLSVEEWIKACRTCILNGRKHQPPPMLRTLLPEAPWDYLAIDYCGPFASQGNIHVIGMVDFYSRYVTTAIVKSTGWQYLEPVLDSIFYRFGYPKAIKSDNGPPFSSNAYKQYCEGRGIERVFSWPLNPQQNGAAEATMKHVNRAIQNATAEGVPIDRALHDRIQAHNDAIHSETSEIPTEVMFGRRLRRGLPMNRSPRATVNDRDIRERDWSAKLKKKVTEDKRRGARSPSIGVGDTVVLERAAKRKGETPYDPTELKVKARMHGNLTLEGADGTVVRRDVTKARKIPGITVPVNEPSQAVEVQDEEQPEVVESGNELGAGEYDSGRPKRMRKRPTRFNFEVREVARLRDTEIEQFNEVENDC